MLLQVVLCCVLTKISYTWGMDILCCPGGECWPPESPYDHLPSPTGCAGDLGVTFDLFTRNNSDVPATLTRNSINASFVGSRESLFLIHGWLNDRESDWMHDIKDALLLTDDYNVILVGWGPGANLLYYCSAANTRVVGFEAAMVANRLVTDAGATFNRITCVGHSLGAHICGQMGRYTAKSIAQVTGLDPAGPGFRDVDNNLSYKIGVDNTSAVFVQIVHTASDPGILVRPGSHASLGHIDFYVNGGRIQPECVTKKVQRSSKFDLLAVSCSHSRAHELYLYSINQKISQSCYEAKQKCENVLNMPSSCTSSASPGPKMGWSTPIVPSTGGNFYLATINSVPYCAVHKNNIPSIIIL